MGILDVPSAINIFSYFFYKEDIFLIAIKLLPKSISKQNCKFSFVELQLACFICKMWPPSHNSHHSPNLLKIMSFQPGIAAADDTDWCDSQC